MLADGSTLALADRDAALLALLAVDGPLPRARIAALLWPDASTERARTSLRQRLFRLRQRAGCELVAAHDVLALADGVRADINGLPALRHDAAALPGELLEGLHYGDDDLGRWVEAAREAWRSRRREALAEAATRHEAEGHVAAALPFAQRLVADEPLLEHAQRRLMRLHHLRGDGAAALAVFEGLRRAMQRELGAVPGEETQALMHRVLAGKPPAAGALRPMPLLHSARMVGRQAEWAALQQAWALPAPALLVGEAGIGKSRLLNDFVAAQPGTLGVQARLGDAAVPYALVARLVRALLGRSVLATGLPAPVREALSLVAVELGPPQPGARINALLLRQAVQVLLGNAGVPAIALDDLHHADAASLDLLAALWAEPEPPLRWLLATRAAGLPALLLPTDRGAAWTRDGSRLCRVELDALDARGVAEMLDALALPGLHADWAAALHRHTRGNPLFVLETLRALLTAGTLPQRPPAMLPLPPLVGQVIEGRLARLSATALQLARVAALAGQDFSLELATVLMDSSLLALSEPWRELEAAQLLRGAALAHDLVLDATRRAVPAAIAQALHGRIAAFLTTQQVAPARLAAHWAAAEDWTQAAQCWGAAAQAAYTASRTDEALRCRESAIDACRRAGDGPGAFDHAVHHIAELLQAGTGDRANLAAEAALALAQDDEQRIKALVMRAHVQHWLMQHERCVDSALQAHRLARRGAHPVLVSHVGIRLALALGQADRAAEGLPVLEEVRGHVMREGDVGMRAMFLCQLANLQSLADDVDSAGRSYADAVATAVAGGQVLLARQALLSSALLHWRCGRWADSVQALEALLPLREGAPPEQALLRNEELHLGLLRRHQGRFGAATDLLERAVAHWRIWGPAPRAVLAENELAQLWLDLGQSARARQALQTAADGAPAYVQVARRMLAVRVAAAADGRPPTALLAGLRALAFEPALRVLPRLLGALEWARHAEPGAARAACEGVHAEAVQRHLGGVAAHARLAIVRCASAADDTGAAGRLALAAWATGDLRQAIDLYVPEGAAWLQRALAAAGLGEASAVHAAAIAWLRAALHDLPPVFAESFRHRQVTNRDWLARAGAAR